MLANEPGITYALTSDTEAEPDAVIITLTMRDKAICELKIPKDRYDGLAMLQMIEKQTGESYAERTRDVSKLRTTHAGRDRECQTIRRYGQYRRRRVLLDPAFTGMKLGERISAIASQGIARAGSYVCYATSIAESPKADTALQQGRNPAPSSTSGSFTS